MRSPVRPRWLIVLIVLAGGPILGSQPPDDAPSADSRSENASAASSDHQSLAAKLQNPFADLILFPMQDITALRIGPDDGTANVLNLQPVFPIPVTKKRNLLARPILPVSYTNVPESDFGLGDLNLEPFLSPNSGGTSNGAWAPSWDCRPRRAIPWARGSGRRGRPSRSSPRRAIGRSR